MAFIPFKTTFVNADQEEYEKNRDMGVEMKEEEGWVYINTRMISSYSKMQNGNIIIWMAGGECYSLLIMFEDFTRLLKDVETVLDLTEIKNN